MRFILDALLLILGVGGFSTANNSDCQTPRLFSDHGDVGACAHAGSVMAGPSRRDFTITGGGENMWARVDAFHFAWTRMSGDVKLAAEIHFPKPGGNAHRKACLMIRQSLAPDSAYVDAALHGNGLASLQFREESGGLTHEVQS